MSRPVITLTTDFGRSDAYVAAMKGVILRLCPDATIVDVSHDIPRHDIAEAAYTLVSASEYYPASAVHAAVIDPGVGSDRRPIALETPLGTYVSPDNGTLTHVLNSFGAGGAVTALGEVGMPDGCRAYELDRPEHWLSHVSRTFHGRDVFAPTAAHLANGVPASALGSPIESVVCLPTPIFSMGDPLTGVIVHVDTYGNLITNIPAESVSALSEIRISGCVIEGLSDSYREAVGGLLAIVGSRDTLEIAIGEGDART